MEFWLAVPVVLPNQHIPNATHRKEIWILADKIKQRRAASSAAVMATVEAETAHMNDAIDQAVAMIRNAQQQGLNRINAAVRRANETEDLKQLERAHAEEAGGALLLLLRRRRGFFSAAAAAASSSEK